MTTGLFSKKAFAHLLLLVFALGCPLGALSASPVLSSGQIVFVPVYSHIYFGDREREFNLAVTLSVRNTDLEGALTITGIEYRGEDGKLIRTYLKDPFSLASLEAKSFVVKESDTAGGAGASFLVKWKSAKPLSPPLIEAVMIGAQMQQGISFTSRGVAVREFSE